MKTIARPSPAFFGKPGGAGGVPRPSPALPSQLARPSSGPAASQAFGSKPPVAHIGPPVASVTRPAAPRPASQPPRDAVDATIASDTGALEFGDGLADAELALEAMQSFRLAEAALQRSDLAGAEQLAQKAVDGDPGQGDYVTLLAWIRALAGHPIDEAIAVMTQVLDDDPSSERARLFRGKLLVQASRPDEALADFEELLAVNPQHRDAQAEAQRLKTRG
jgi:hypothetical protein